MKKILSTRIGRTVLGVLLSVVLVLCACGSNAASSEPAPTDTTAKTETFAEAVEDSAPETTEAATKASLAEEVEARTAIIFSILEDGLINVERDGEDEEAYEGMRLTVGDVVKTDDKGQVYLRIDDDKNILLAEKSSMEISECKSGMLKLSLLDGEFFFEVVNPLADDDSMSFDVGGITMNIRGTSGGGKTDEKQSKGYLLTGKSDVFVIGGDGKEVDGEISTGQEITLDKFLTTGSTDDIVRVTALDVDTLNLNLINNYVRSDPSYVGRLVDEKNFDAFADNMKEHLTGKIILFPGTTELTSAAANENQTQPQTQAPTQAQTQAETQEQTTAAESESSNEQLIENDLGFVVHTDTGSTGISSGGGGYSGGGSGGSNVRPKQSQEETTLSPTEATTAAPTQASKECYFCGEKVTKYKTIQWWTDEADSKEISAICCIDCFMEHGYCENCYDAPPSVEYPEGSNTWLCERCYRAAIGEREGQSETAIMTYICENCQREAPELFEVEVKQGSSGGVITKHVCADCYNQYYSNGNS